MAFKTLLHAAVRGIGHIMYPQRCVGCGAFHPSLSDTVMLCPTCLSVWEDAKESACSECGLCGAKCRCLPRYTTLAETQGQGRSPISAYYHLVPYHISLIQRMLFHIKDGRDADTVLFLSRELLALCDAALRAYPLTPKEKWCIAYVPRHPMRMRESNTDQCKAIAKEISYLTKLPLVRPLVHTGYRTEQKHLSLSQRAMDARRCYRASKDAKVQISGKYILLIDDILTSGATTVACAELLKENGAEAIVCVTVAKTELGQKNK